MNNTYEVEIELDEPLTKAANRYYALSKKYRKKVEGVKKAMEITKKKIENANKIKVVEKEVIAKRDKQWYEKYRWSFTANGFLIIAGRDSNTNELIVKKYMEKNDYHFHTNIQGSAHVILKNGQSASKEDFETAGVIAAIYSKAWSSGISSVDVYFVKPEQVTKTAESGEYISTGAFVIRGERNWLKKTKLEFTVGILEKEDTLLAVSTKNVFEKSKSPYHIDLIPGTKSKSDIGKIILKELAKLGYKQFTINDLLSILPAGKFDIKKK